ncbi:putative capsid and scaffold protein [Pseudomonas phage Njord]|uniref:Putative capsid and scaffold protein n=1 Tax=Pseudomonas phage Njord TaxID=2163985 RepID=A0A2S1GMM5_9CAUD|nr:putative capsid and scaffold protein [Pseudomonas phage Njord]AWD90624.1 putative capsid and scaffold protein [Pseudomonas phage Njord]
MIKRDGHYELMHADRPYDSGFRSVQIETEPEPYEWERVPMFDGQLWFAIFQRPSKVCIRNSLSDGFTLTTKIFNNKHIAQAVFNIDGNEYLPRHNKLKCYVEPQERDFTGHRLSFTMNMTPGAYRGADLPFGTSLTLTDGNGVEWYIRLWQYCNPATALPDKLDVLIDFDNLYTGFSDEDPNRQKVPVTDLRRISINVVDTNYYAKGGFDAEGIEIEPDPELPIKVPTLADVVVANIVCVQKLTGVVKTHARGRPQNADGSDYQTDLGIATSFDDIANTSPRRVVEDMYKLGYRGVINHYMGISNYPKLIFMEDTQQFQLDPVTCLDEVVRLWHEDFLQQCVRLNFQCIVAVSMEVFYDYVKWNWRSWMQLCQGFQVLEVDDEYIKIEGKHPWSTTANPFLGGFEHQGLFNPNKEWAADIRFAHPEDGGVETTYQLLEVNDVPNENKTQLKLDKRFRGWYGDYSVGKPALTGYNPPSTFFNTNIVAVEGATYIDRAFKELADIIPPGMKRMFQVGEPWYWDGSYQNERLFIYDKPTLDAALADGVEIPVWENIRSFTKQNATAQELAAANWLRDSLGAYTQAAKTSTLAAYPDAEFSCLTFIPQIFTTKSEITPIINFPFQHWKYPNFEFFQYEAYDTIIWGDLEFTNSYCDYAFDKLGYPVEKTNYLGGFSPNKDPTGRVWRNIAHQLSWPNTKLDAGYHPMQSLIWASTQVNRDSVMFTNDGGKLPVDKPIWDLVLEEVSDWAEYSRQDKFWLPSVYSITNGVNFTQRKTANESRVDQWYLVNPDDPLDKVASGNPVTTRRTIILATQPAVGLKDSTDFYTFAYCDLIAPQPNPPVYPPGHDAEGQLDQHLSARFDYDKDRLDGLGESSIDWGDGSPIQEGITENTGAYPDGPEPVVIVDELGNETTIWFDATYHQYTQTTPLEAKLRPQDAAEFTMLTMERAGVQDIDFGVFPLATTMSFAYNDMTTVQLDALIDKLMYFSDERAREAYRRRVELHLYIGQQSTDEHASPEKIEALVRFFNNLGVTMVVHS